MRNHLIKERSYGHYVRVIYLTTLFQLQIYSALSGNSEVNHENSWAVYPLVVGDSNLVLPEATQCLAVGEGEERGDRDPVDGTLIFS